MFERRGRVMRPAAAAVLALVLGQAHGQQEPRVDDPMRPYSRIESSGTEGPAVRDVALTAVLISPSRRVAVINGGVYREGDEVAGARVTRIRPGAVEIRRDGELRILALDSSGARASANTETQVDDSD